METTEIAEIARKYAVMVRIQGPDPKGLKMRRHPFHVHQDGRTTLSASGILLPESVSGALPVLESAGRKGALVITAASIVECFLPVRHNAIESLAPAQVILPELIVGAHMEVLVDQGSGVDGVDVHTRWLDARLLALVNVPSAAIALEQLVRNNGSPESGSWDVGWSLTPLVSTPNSYTDVLNHEVPVELSRSFPQKIASSTRIALLEICDIKCPQNMAISLPQKGGALLVMGSPFGILSPSHFFNSISVGTVANFCPTGPSQSSLLVADIRCLPGMEGAPVYDKCGHLVGILTRPLRQKGCTAEIQIVITWDAILLACSSQPDGLHGSFLEINEHKGSHPIRKMVSPSCELTGQRPTAYPLSHRNSKSPLENAIASVVLVAVGDGAWASGIILNSDGLILTNAHLLEPWRYGKGSLFSVTSKTGSLPLPSERVHRQLEQTSFQNKENTSLSSLLSTSAKIVDGVKQDPFQDSRYTTYQKLRVRLNHSKPWVWSDARVVYISQGPIDVSLLQLEYIPQQLVPIAIDYAPPLPGSKVHVIGHGPFGPRSDIYPYVSSGVISRLVKGPRSLEGPLLEAGGSLPIMIETTATVYPGMSGGAVVNSEGFMVGLVTSNARHGGGVIIPEINFSIPCTALEPIFKFSTERNPALLQIYNKPDDFLSSVWALRPPPPSEPEPPRDSKNKGVVKGSRFAEFLAKRQAENLTKGKELDVAERLPNSKPPDSKL